MRIIIDVMSGDNAPTEILRGAAMAAEEYPVEIVVSGDKNVIAHVAATESISLKQLTILPSESVIEMQDAPLSVVREKSSSSMALGLKMLAHDQGDAFVSAGNTGALVAGATLIVRRIKGVKRAAISTILPFETPVLLLDSGANLEVTPENIEQFARMGSIYMSKIYGIASPRVGLLNNGSEETKGLELQRDSYQRLTASDLNFIGNVEGNAIPFNVCDVLVCDGFSGNIALKSIEGMAKFMGKAIKGAFCRNVLSKVSGLLMRQGLTVMKKRFDSSEHGGAPILGISKPVIKAHGNSDAMAIKNAVRQAIAYVNTGAIFDIAAMAAASCEAQNGEDSPKNE